MEEPLPEAHEYVEEVASLTGVCSRLFLSGWRLGLLESVLDFFEDLFYLVNGHDALPKSIGAFGLAFGINDHGVCWSAFCHVRRI